ncbi:MAG: hypothetical protein PHT12_04515 [Patescibacteria group bacterium]|nr:hypothetical protein [Patescibacteria group bacterium]
MSKLTDHPLIRELLTLGLPPDDFAIFGSGPMLAHGLKEANDLDIIARGMAWQLAQALGEVRRSAGGGVKAVFANGRIEIFPDWGPGDWNVNTLIDQAEIIDGIRFVTLENVLKWKKMMNRPKDAEHIRIIEDYLKGH